MKTVQTQYMHSLYAKGNEEFIKITSEENLESRKQAIGCQKAKVSVMKRHYEVDLPYPEVEVEYPSKEYLKLILEDYAGNSSEMTAINQYDYQQLILDNPKYEEIAEILEEISKVEGTHRELLGEMIIGLGGDPRYWSIKQGMTVYWSPQYVDYTKDPKQMLQNNIRSEEMAIRQYNQHISMIGDPHIKAVLRRIVLDEKLHVEIFKDLYTQYFG